MISCTDFIPAYSELFTYLEEKHGKEEVRRYWDFIFTPVGKGSPLLNYLQSEGIRGCYSYWAGTLNEEAADFTMYLNEPKGWYMEIMHKCPSKGRLLELAKETDIKPYEDYCFHCDGYRKAVEKAGLKYIYNFNGIDHAACSMLIYDPNIFDGQIIIDENTVIMDRRASQNEYFHRAFHNSLNRGICYVGTKFGTEAVIEFLEQYTPKRYAPLLKKVKEQGLFAIEEEILDTYKKEKSEDAVETHCTEDVLQVTVKYCPAVKYLKSAGKEVSPWYRLTTETVMGTLAKETGYRFEMEAYDEQTGAAKYSFKKE